jgi:hypothetical protein
VNLITELVIPSATGYAISAPNSKKKGRAPFTKKPLKPNITQTSTLLNEMTLENIKHTIRIENVAQAMNIRRNSFKCPEKRSANLKTEK